MRKINKFFIALILLATMFLGIGYSAIQNITLEIKGSVMAEAPTTFPYLPKGFSEVNGTSLETGLTIQDSLGNQYVWVEVPKSLYNDASYNTKDTTADMKPAAKTDYDKIEYCLHQYTATYRNGTKFTDSWSSQEAAGLTSEGYTKLKQTMLSSVYENGGFYIGKYETGIADTEPNVVDTTHEARTKMGDTTQTPVIQANAYPYNFVTCKQAQALSSGMESGEYTSSLMFGVQFDLVLKHLETKGVKQEYLISDSTSLGNYANNWYTITNEKSKYYVSSWVDGNYGKKTSNVAVLLSTGANSSFCKMGIYDFAGNVYEWTLEYTGTASKPCSHRGCYYAHNGKTKRLIYRSEYNATFADIYDGFRVSIF